MAELKSLRVEVARSRRENEILTTASAFFAARPDLVDRRFEAGAPNRLHVADVFARRIVVWSCATTMDAKGLPPQALEQVISWAASHGGTDGLVLHGNHGVQYIGTVYATRVRGTRHASLDRHARRLVRQRHGRIRRRRI